MREKKTFIDTIVNVRNKIMNFNKLKREKGREKFIYYINLIKVRLYLLHTHTNAHAYKDLIVRLSSRLLFAMLNQTFHSCFLMISVTYKNSMNSYKNSMNIINNL